MATKRKHETHEIQLQQTANLNKDITDILTEVGWFEKVQGQIHKYNAYSKAVREIAAYPKRIESVCINPIQSNPLRMTDSIRYITSFTHSKGAEAALLDGVGKKLSKKIDEILRTGSLCKLEKLKADEQLSAMRLISRVSGVGPSAGMYACSNRYHVTRRQLDT